jgi:hypothetical protein
MAVAVLGLILLVAAGLLTTAVVTSNTGAVDTDLWGTTISNLSLGAVFVAGMLTTLVGVAGLLLLTAALRRGRRLRRERKVLRRENERLAQQVGDASADGTPPERHGVWRRRAEPPEGATDTAVADSSFTGRESSGVAGTRRFDRTSVEAATPSAEERPAEDVPRSTGSSRARATSDSGG